MKKFIAMLLCIGFLMTGCSNKDDKDNTVKSTFDTFETDLKDAGIEVKDRAENLADKIGAKEGYRYQTGDGYVEMYHYDDEDMLKTITNNGYVEDDGKQYPVKVNGNWVLFTDNLAHESDVTKIFNNMK